MTYTIVGRCARTGQLGVGIATYSLAAGGYCPFVKPGVGAVSSQAAADPRLGALALRLLGARLSPEGVVQELARRDEHIEYRQIGVLDGEGAVAGDVADRPGPGRFRVTGEEGPPERDTQDTAALKRGGVTATPPLFVRPRRLRAPFDS